MNNMDYIVIRGGVVQNASSLSSEYSDRVCHILGIPEEYREVSVLIADYDRFDPLACNAFNGACWSYVAIPSKRVKQARNNEAEKSEERRVLYEELLTPRDKKLGIILSFGRENPEDDFDEKDPLLGPRLYVDWIHVTYLADISFGWKSAESAADFGPADNGGNVLFFHKDMLAVNDGNKTTYYSDWEIIPVKHGEPV